MRTAACLLALMAIVGCGRPPAPDTAPDQPPATKPATSPATAPAPPTAKATSPAPPVTPDPPAPKRFTAKAEPAVIDGLRVDVLSAREWKEAGGDLFRVECLATTADDGRTYRTQDWHRHASLYDDRGNAYPKQYSTFPPYIDDGASEYQRLAKLLKITEVLTGEGAGPLTSRQPRHAVLFFEMPPPAVKTLNFDLDGQAVGVNGVFRFTVPVMKR